MASDVMEQQLSRDEQIALKNRRLGLAIFQLSWIMVFVALIFVNLTMRAQTTGWPPPGVAAASPVVPTLMTLALIASSLIIRRALRAVRADEHAAFVSNWRIAVALGALFVVVMAIEWLAVPYSGMYSNVYRLLIGFHGVHALVIGFFLVHVLRHAHRYNARHFWMVEASAGLWYFVTIAWLLFYAVLYVI